MPEKEPAFEIHKVYQEEAESLIKARKSSRIHHRAGDIHASGDEVEMPVRNFIKKRLPQKYLVGHGHIVDSYLNISAQEDIVIADTSATPILYEGKNGKQYFPYESVYAWGEIKSTYYRSQSYIAKFSEKNKILHGKLKRENTPASYIGNGVSIGKGFSSSIKVPYQNPVFSFMIFIDSNDVTPRDLMEQYSRYDDEYLPNIVCFLDGKLIVKSNLLIGADNNSNSLEINCNTHDVLKNNKLIWSLIKPKNGKYKNGLCLAILIMVIFDHLRNCRLMEPPINNYLNNFIKQRQGFTVDQSIDFRSLKYLNYAETSPLLSRMINNAPAEVQITRKFKEISELVKDKIP